MEDILVPATKAHRTEGGGGKQHGSDQARCYYYAAIQEASIFWNYLLMNIYYSFYFKKGFMSIRQLYIHWCPIWSQILKAGPMISCTTTVPPQRSFHTNTLKHGLSICRYTEHTHILCVYWSCCPFYHELAVSEQKSDLLLYLKVWPDASPWFCHNTTQQQNIKHVDMKLQNWKFPWGFSLQSKFTHPLRTGMLRSSKVH